MEVPRLKDWGVSPETGFLPEQVPAISLPVEFAPWEAIALNLPKLIQTQKLRRAVDKMPYILANKLNSVEEQRQAYSILGFLANAYVWSPPKVHDHLPKQLSDPLLYLSELLGLPPLSTYAGLCLWNFRTIDPTLPPIPKNWTLENLETTYSFTGSREEAWFYLISVAMERQGGDCLKNGIAAIKACMRDNIPELVTRLNKLSQDIEDLTKVMMRMSEQLTPDFFYNELRPYLAGWKGMEKAGLPRGVRYGDSEEYLQYSGGSNGQSSLIQALDIILNVEHHALGLRQPPGPLPKPRTSKAVTTISKPKTSAFLQEMRNYMPREHREFLETLETCAVIRPFVVSHGSNNPELADSYDTCIKTLSTFRSKHIQIVMRYISLPSRKQQQQQQQQQQGSSSSSINGTGLSASNTNGGETGTGGTQLMPFLKQSRDEVSDAAVGDWNRNILSAVEPKPKNNHS